MLIINPIIFYQCLKSLLFFPIGVLFKGCTWIFKTISQFKDNRIVFQNMNLTNLGLALFHVVKNLMSNQESIQVLGYHRFPISIVCPGGTQLNGIYVHPSYHGEFVDEEIIQSILPRTSTPNILSRQCEIQISLMMSLFNGMKQVCSRLF